MVILLIWIWNQLKLTFQSYHSANIIDFSFSRMINSIPSVSDFQTQTTLGSNETAAICLLAKDEEKYLTEWIDYNLLVLGFDAIYIYDNSENFTLQNYTNARALQLLDTTKTTSIAKPEARIVVEHQPYNWQQRAVYKKCLKDHGQNHTWMALLDGDEFLVLKLHNSVIDMLHDHCQSGSLSINWFLFGTANHEKYEPLPVLKRFQYREPNATALHKVIVKTSDFDWNSPKQKRGVNSPHFVDVIANTTMHNTNGEVTFDVSSPNGPTNVVVLHHYMYKSVEEWHYKWCTRGNVAGIHRRCGEPPLVGTVHDDSAWKALVEHVPWYE